MKTQKTGMQLFRDAYKKPRKKHKAVSTDPKDIKPNPTLPGPNKMEKLAYKRKKMCKHKRANCKSC